MCRDDKLFILFWGGLGFGLLAFMVGLQFRDTPIWFLFFAVSVGVMVYRIIKGI